MPKRIFQIAILCVAAVTMLGAGTSTTRFDRLGEKLVCQCGCGQILTECNHLGCPVSPVMLTSLRAQIAAGHSEGAILQTFIAKYGPIVLAEPIRGGFDDVAWIVPFAIFLLATLGVAFLIRFWLKRHAKLHPDTANSPSETVTDAVRERIRRDTQ